jgi:3D (Asp-Asp-Asp) domain-containing protein
MCVRTTAYTHTEKGGTNNAIGTRLRFGGEVSSASTDWSWMPLGTRFLVQETGRTYVVEDYVDDALLGGTLGEHRGVGVGVASNEPDAARPTAQF